MRLMLRYVVLLALSSSALAGAESIQLNKYFQADCQSYNGTWQGFVTDPTDLIGNGGPWPVTVSLSADNGQIWGRTTAFSGSGNKATFKSNEIWARCKDGRLQDIYWGKKGDCGGLSQQGVLVSKNVLVIQINWENAMNGSNLLLFLQRKNNLSPYAEPSHVNSYDPAKVQTCH